MPELPAKKYLRRGVVRDYLCIDDDEFTKLVRTGVLKPVYLGGRGRAFFERAAVVAAETAGKIFKPKTANTK